jgi:hypothetical protein
MAWEPPWGYNRFTGIQASNSSKSSSRRLLNSSNLNCRPHREQKKKTFRQVRERERGCLQAGQKIFPMVSILLLYLLSCQSHSILSDSPRRFSFPENLTRLIRGSQVRKKGGFFLLLVVGILFGPGLLHGVLPPQQEQAPSGFLQFTAGNHVLGFQPGGLYVAAPDHFLKITFEKARTVHPVAEDGSRPPQTGKVRSLVRVNYPGVVAGDQPDLRGGGRDAGQEHLSD